MGNRKIVVSMLLAGVSIMGVVNQASANLTDFVNSGTGLTGCYVSRFTIPVTQNSDNKIIWNMDSSITSRDGCYAKVDRMYPDKYSADWNDATAECSNMWSKQKANVAQTTAEIQQMFPNCNNVSDYITEQTGDR